jgi:hypothetical protein
MIQQHEPPCKRLKPNPRSFLSNQPDEMVCKRLNSDPKSLFVQQPDEMVDHMFSWCDFQSLVTLRATSHRLKGIAEIVLERRALNDLSADALPSLFRVLCSTTRMPPSTSTSRLDLCGFDRKGYGIR